MAVNFSDLVKQYGSVSAALSATGNTKGEDGVWRSNGASSSGGSTSTSGSSSSSAYKPQGSSGSTSNANSYAGIYKVQDNGKAQSGLSAGDRVVTGGGTYEITGVRADGTYESKLVDKNTTTKNYAGSYSSGSSSKGYSGSSGSVSSADPYAGTNYHQDAIDAAARGDWDAVNTALTNRQNKIDNTGGNDYGISNAQILADLQKQYGAVPTPGEIQMPNFQNIQITPAGSGWFDSGAWSDASQYIRDMYEQQAAEQMAALKATYEQNVRDYRAQDDIISAAAQRQRNQAAAQNDLQRMYMNEMGIMSGLNTGATGQMALAQSADLQGNLANIGTQEAQSLADNSMALAKLKAQYSAAMDQAEANGNYQLASALYNEYVRQQNLAIQKQAAAQEQANWEAKMAYQQAQDALAQQNWQAQFDYKKQQDDLNYQLALQKLYRANVGSTGGALNPGTTSGGYDNGSLTTAQVMQLQQKLGVTPDGKWGAKSSEAAKGMTADEAWAKYGGYDMSFEELKSTLTRYLSLGGAQRAQNILDSHWDSLTPAQQKELSDLFG